MLSRAICVLLCSLALAPARLPAQSDAELLKAGIPAADYPRSARHWIDASGRHQVLARLVDVNSSAVRLQTQDRGQITVPVAKLDKASQLIAQDAQPYFVLERLLQSVIHEMLTRGPELDLTQRSDIERALMKQANQMTAGLTLRTRYRIIGVSDRMEAKVTGSKTGEYVVTVRPLYRIQAMPASYSGRPKVGAYLNGWYFRAEDFDPRQVVLNKSIIEFTAKPVIAHYGHHHFHVMGIKYMSTGIGFGFNGPKVRVFTPTVAESEDIRLGGGVDAGGFPAHDVRPKPAPTAKTTGVPLAGRLPQAQPSEATPVGPSASLADMIQQQFRERAEQQVQRILGGGEREATVPSTEPEEAQKPIGISGSGKKVTLKCDGESVSVSGTNHEITITGRCGRIQVSGINHAITVDEVAVISISGSNNTVEYRSGPQGKPPEVKQTGSSNKAVPADEAQAP
ncbi:MAG: DUF3060 domain-containing protein [Planctomycetes bacterium]|nr:DUF3060 domain-containing protein [Planctomycetota bacterium]MBL7037516.1 DUF3060 domain-containing protein [Pirellulaceae bacterium]